LPIPNKEALKILKRLNLRYAGLTIKPAIDADYEYIEVYSGKLPIYTKHEFKIAEKIGKGFNLELKWMDFGRGEKEIEEGEVKYEPVYVARCATLNELKEAPKKISKALELLKEELKKIERN
jgi:hypothetical protein